MVPSVVLPCQHIPPQWTGCPCGCTSAPGRPDPECARFRPLRVVIDYSQQFEFSRLERAA
jgi:hypothetical protein